MSVPDIILNNGVRMPRLGFGVWQVSDDEAERAVATAIEAGYRSIDTAKLYANEAGVGRAVKASGLPREELFVTTKLWNDDHAHQDAITAFEASLSRLGLDYVDLYLIHWPVAGSRLYVDAWRALEKLHADGRIRAIGVSNFNPEHLTTLVDETSVVPAVDQVELHPYFPQKALREFGTRLGVATEAWSPLGQGRGLLEDPVLVELARRYGKSPAQVVLRWHLQLGNIVIPKSVTPARIRENIDVFDIELTPRDMAAIDALDRGRRYGPDPATF